MAMDSLAARRGAPRVYYSDCGTNFVAAAKTYVDPNGQRPRWKFNPPGAPHTGGAWERLIGVTKRVLQGLEMERNPTPERLRWFLARAEYIVNSRPLTEVPTASEGEAAITPNDLLLGSSATDWNEELDLRTVLTHRNEDVDRFWRRWSMEYLHTIAVRTKWTAKERTVQPGDLVFICDGDYRAGWRRGRVEAVSVDQEAQQVREVVVVTADGSRFRRALTSIAPILVGGGEEQM